MNRQFPLTKAIYVLLVAIAVIAIFESAGLPPARESADIGPAVYPVALSVLIIAFSLLDCFLSSGIHKTLPLRDLAQAMGTGVVMLLAIWLSTVVGLFIILPIASFVTLWIAGSKRLLANAAYSVIFAGVIWVLFDKLLLIPLDSL